MPVNYIGTWDELEQDDRPEADEPEELEATVDQYDDDYDRLTQ